MIIIIIIVLVFNIARCLVVHHHYLRHPHDHQLSIAAIHHPFDNNNVFVIGTSPFYWRPTMMAFLLLNVSITRQPHRSANKTTGANHLRTNTVLSSMTQRQIQAIRVVRKTLMFLLRTINYEWCLANAVTMAATAYVTYLSNQIIFEHFQWQPKHTFSYSIQRNGCTAKPMQL